MAAPEKDAPTPDEALIARVAEAGDRVAFGELFRRYSGKIRGFLAKGGASIPEAEEATQEVFVTIWRKAALFDPAKAGASTWIYTIARNKRIDMIRRTRRAEPDPQDPSFLPDPVQSSEATVSGTERDLRVRAAILALPEDQLRVIRLAFFNGLSHSEIAAELGVPLGTVKSRLRLSFARLRGDLGVEFSDELLEP